MIKSPETSYMFQKNIIYSIFLLKNNVIYMINPKMGNMVNLPHGGCTGSWGTSAWGKGLLGEVFYHPDPENFIPIPEPDPKKIG